MDNLYRKVKYNILRKITKLSCVIGCTTEKVCIVLGGATLHKDMTNMLAVGSTIGPPAERLYPVVPVGVEMITPSA